jgi:hypothetical protein
MTELAESIIVFCIIHDRESWGQYLHHLRGLPQAEKEEELLRRDPEP